MSEPNEEFQKVLESMLENLKKTGANVTGGSFAPKLDQVKDLLETSSPSMGESLRKNYGKNTPKNLVKVPLNSSDEQADALAKFIKKTIDSNAPNIRDDLKKEECFCPNCFNFETFESVLGKFPGGKFAYTSFEVPGTGRSFDVKFWENENGSQQLMVNPIVDTNPEKAEKELIANLGIAVSKGDYEGAALITEKLKQLKTKK